MGRNGKEMERNENGIGRKWKEIDRNGINEKK